jgi:hypothetical protein
MMKKLILFVVLVLIFILFFSLFLSADVYVKVMERTEAYEMSGKGHPERVEIKEQWMATNKFAVFSKEINIIVDYQKEKIYFIVNSAKKYYELPTSIDMEKLQELIPPKAAEIISSIKISDVKVNLSGEKKKIANWDCQEIEFEMMIMIPALNIMPKFKMKLWATKDVPFDYKKYAGGMGEFYGNFVMKLLNVDEDSRKELEKMDKIEGFQISAEVAVNMFGSEINVESQVLEVVEKPAPAGIYSPPRGYTKGNLGVDLGMKKKPPLPKKNRVKKTTDLP